MRADGCLVRSLISPQCRPTTVIGTRACWMGSFWPAHFILQQTETNSSRCPCAHSTSSLTMNLTRVLSPTRASCIRTAAAIPWFDIPIDTRTTLCHYALLPSSNLTTMLKTTPDTATEPPTTGAAGSAGSRRARPSVVRERVSSSFGDVRVVIRALRRRGRLASTSSGQEVHARGTRLADDLEAAGLSGGRRCHGPFGDFVRRRKGPFSDALEIIMCRRLLRTLLHSDARF